MRCMIGYFNSARAFRNNRLWVAVGCLFLYTSTTAQPLDFAKADYWMVLPEKNPEFFKKKTLDSTWISKVDVFYVYPTFLVDAQDSRWNLPFEDQAMREDILQKAVKFQASAWLECGRLFVPFYRQAHLRAYDSIQGRGREALLFAYEDVKAAFVYYLDHYNQGRPFVLAGHSQGSTQLNLLIKEFIDGKPLSKQLVAAYLPGIGIDSNEIQQLPFMTKPNGYGGYVSWNTMYEKPDTYRYPVWYKNRLCINPLSWDLSPHVDRTAHQGFLYQNGSIYKNCFDADLCQGAVCLKRAKWPISWMAKNYPSLHVGDVNLFWKDIGMNCKARINAYFSNE
ncbi:MAG: DUF3089 domain-containing protein [Flavobacteriia bacterium]|nr:DUF3089 domain-containing protein [Flavobacteriia bacterium]